MEKFVMMAILEDKYENQNDKNEFKNKQTRKEINLENSLK